MYEWASKHSELQTACYFWDSLLIKTPFKWTYKHFEPVMQNGPTCGLSALSMITGGKVTTDTLLDLAVKHAYSYNGEMFSCDSLRVLSEEALSIANMNSECNIICDGLFNESIIKKLLEGACLLVPYDSDGNHAPCLRRGHKAHWALICGVIIIEDPEEMHHSNKDNMLVLCRHGKSKKLAIWNFHDLHCSNNNLVEVSPKRIEDSLKYVIPDGGIGGKYGLRGRFLMFDNL